MTERSMDLIDVARQCGDQDLLRRLAETTLVKLMEWSGSARAQRRPPTHRNLTIAPQLGLR